MTQEKQILKHLKSHVGITRMEAITRYGIVNLPGRIYDLKKHGFPIATINREVKNRYGETCRISEYRLCKKK